MGEGAGVAPVPAPAALAELPPFHPANLARLSAIAGGSLAKLVVALPLACAGDGIDWGVLRAGVGSGGGPWRWSGAGALGSGGGPVRGWADWIGRGGAGAASRAPLVWVLARDPDRDADRDAAKDGAWDAGGDASGDAG